VAAVAAATAAVTLATLPGPAEAADGWYVTYGNSYTSGSLNWYNRSVQFKDTSRAVSYCRYFEVSSTGGGIWDRKRWEQCPQDETVYYNDVLNNDVAGGPTDVYISIYDTSGNLLRRQHCDRYSELCDPQHS
jgi:hypothetical protein